jgi:hypothetical protein
MSASYCNTTRHHNPEDGEVSLVRENCKSRVGYFFPRFGYSGHTEIRTGNEMISSSKLFDMLFRLGGLAMRLYCYVAAFVTDAVIKSKSSSFGTFNRF